MDWITTANGMIALLTGLLGLIGTGVGTFFAIRNWLKAMKEKSAKEVWNSIMLMADAAMESVEQSGKKGMNAKNTAMEAVKASCIAAGLNLTPFLEQLSAYIDQCISFHNNMTAANEIAQQQKQGQ